MGPDVERKPFLTEVENIQQSLNKNLSISSTGAAAGCLGYACYAINLDILNGSRGARLIALSFELCWNQMPPKPQLVFLSSREI